MTLSYLQIYRVYRRDLSIFLWYLYNKGLSQVMSRSSTHANNNLFQIIFLRRQSNFYTILLEGQKKWSKCNSFVRRKVFKLFLSGKVAYLLQRRLQHYSYVTIYNNICNKNKNSVDIYRKLLNVWKEFYFHNVSKRWWDL